MTAVFKKEFKSFFTGVTGSVFIAFLLCFTGIYVTLYNLRSGYSAFEMILPNVVIIFLLIVPILTMRSFAEEKHQRTDKLLYSLPISVTEIVLGKYLAMLCVFAIPVAVMALYPIVLSAFGQVAYKSAYLALLGFFMLGAALIALSMFMSSLTESQVIAAITGFGALMLMYLMNLLSASIPDGRTASVVCFLLLAAAMGLLVFLFTKNYYVSLLTFFVLSAVIVSLYIAAPAAFEGLFPALLTYLAVFDRFTALTGGIFDIGAIVYLITFAVFFIYLTVQSLEKRRIG